MKENSHKKPALAHTSPVLIIIAATNTGKYYSYMAHKASITTIRGITSTLNQYTSWSHAPCHNIPSSECDKSDNKNTGDRSTDCYCRINGEVDEIWQTDPRHAPAYVVETDNAFKHAMRETGAIHCRKTRMTPRRHDYDQKS